MSFFDALDDMATPDRAFADCAFRFLGRPVLETYFGKPELGTRLTTLAADQLAIGYFTPDSNHELVFPLLGDDPGDVVTIRGPILADRCRAEWLLAPVEHRNGLKWALLDTGGFTDSDRPERAFLLSRIRSDVGRMNRRSVILSPVAFDEDSPCWRAILNRFGLAQAAVCSHFVSREISRFRAQLDAMSGERTDFSDPAALSTADLTDLELQSGILARHLARLRAASGPLHPDAGLVAMLFANALFDQAMQLGLSMQAQFGLSAQPSPNVRPDVARVGTGMSAVLLYNRHIDRIGRA